MNRHCVKSLNSIALVSREKKRVQIPVLVFKRWMTMKKRVGHSYDRLKNINTRNLQRCCHLPNDHKL